MKIIAKQSGRFTETEIDDEIVVMHLGTGEFLALTATAAAIWRLIDGRSDLARLVEEMSSAFDGRRHEIEADVEDFLDELEAMGLIKIG